MASTDWAYMTNVLSSGDCARGVTSGTTKPNGGGNFVYAVNSLTSTVGVVGLYTAQTNFAPMSKGCDISAAMCRYTSGGLTGFSAFMFASVGGPDVSDTGYILGLSDGDPSHIELRKGAISIGLPDEAPGGTNTILARSTETVNVATWMHLRLEVVVQSFGDVFLNVYKNNLLANPVNSPVWVPIPGMSQVIDDALGINTGSLPFTSGRAGFGARVAEVTRRALFRYVRIARQL